MRGARVRGLFGRLSVRARTSWNGSCIAVVDGQTVRGNVRMVNALPTTRPFPDEIRRLQQMLSGKEPAGLQKYIATPRLNEPYATGSMTPHLGVIALAGTTAGGVVLPRFDQANQPIKYFSAYVGLDEYLGKVLSDEVGTYDNDRWIEILLSQHPRELMVIELAFINSSLRRPKLESDLLEQFKKMLPEPFLGYFNKAMVAPDLQRVFLARQPILRAMREALLYRGETKQTMPFPLPMTAVMLAHGFATKLGHLDETGPDLWPQMKASVAMELIQNFLFNQREDIFARFDRYARLWGEYGVKLQRTKLRASPDEIVKEATGIDRLDLFAVAFSLLARVLGWQPGQNFHVDPYSGVGMDRATFDAALALCAADQATLVAELREAPTDWAMLPFERHPVLRLGQSVVVMDQDYLLDRVTSGLYWVVLNHEIRVYGKDAKEANLWSQAYSEMIEALAEDSLRVMAPPLWGSAGGKTFYTEDDFGAAYGGRAPRCDAGIHFGNVLALFEVQKGQVSLDTRQLGLAQKFISDTERMVLSKAKQLQGTADAVFANERALTGFPPTDRLRVWPVAVQGATYPVNPITTEYITIQLKARHLLDGRDDPRLHPFAVVDIGELEMLEGLVGNKGVGVIDALEGWKAGPGFRWSFRNYLLEKYGGGDVNQFRPKRMGSTVDELNHSLIARLRVSPGS